MKAVFAPKAGPPEILEIRDIPKPEPRKSEILVRVHCATVTSGDANLRRFNRVFLGAVGLIAGFKVMKVPGVEYSGVVEAAGAGVSAFKPGDQVRGTTTGLAMGANAEYVCVPEHPKMGVLIHKAPELSHKEAAAVCVGAMTALFFLRKAGVREGDSVLVYGASGSVGSAAVQLARHFGARVTAVCSGANAPLVSDLGAERVIDYRTSDFRDEGNRYDIIIDAVGKLKKSGVKDSLTDGGRFLTVKSMTKEIKEEMEFLQDLQVSEELKPVITEEFSLDRITEAHRLVDSGRKRGNVVIPIVAEP
ncbi:MAG: NAD(P)-dependent alcohol dehydrogenase [Spirochaetales bacterium]|nr:NAD(P)-dependent alcohol dehydrogenase [Spirochaetales bacterium]